MNWGVLMLPVIGGSAKAVVLFNHVFPPYRALTAFYVTLYVHTILLKVKVKESRNRPGVVRRVPGGLGYQISMAFGT
jgi:hypothetical protein